LLLEYLARRRGHTVTRTEIEAHIYDGQVDPMSNVVDSAVCSIRKKLTAAGAPAMIHTRRGLGYILDPNTPGTGG
jgi:DNA-binding response OmpR family regulator